MDGVLCRPITWFNLVISRDIQRPLDFPDRPTSQGVRGRVIENQIGHALRFAWRPPMPGVREGLSELAGIRRLVLLSGRPELSRVATEQWLERHGLRGYFAEVV